MTLMKCMNLQEPNFQLEPNPNVHQGRLAAYGCLCDSWSSTYTLHTCISGGHWLFVLWSFFPADFAFTTLFYVFAAVI